MGNIEVCWWELLALGCEALPRPLALLSEPHGRCLRGHCADESAQEGSVKSVAVLESELNDFFIAVLWRSRLQEHTGPGGGLFHLAV